MDIRKAIEIYVRIPDAVNEDDAENILYDALDSGLMNSSYNIESWNMKYIPDFDDFAYPVESSTSIQCSTRYTYKVDWLNKALQNMQEDEYFVPRLSVNDNGRYIDLDEGAIQVLIDYYS